MFNPPGMAVAQVATKTKHTPRKKSGDEPAVEFTYGEIISKNPDYARQGGALYRWDKNHYHAIDPKDENDARVLKQIAAGLDEVVKRMNAPEAPIQSAARINEVSSAFEDMMREVMDAKPGFGCEFPRTAEDRVQRSGYPDLRLFDKVTKRVYYMDPKLYAEGSRDSSFRTFYFEPKVGTNKVRDDAVHLILGFEHAPRKAGHWEFTRWDIVDLARFRVRLKAEFEGSNRDMYRPEAIVGSSAPGNNFGHR